MRFLLRTLRAATHGSGVFERDLLGEPTAISEDYRIISDFRLEQNYPNPFNPTTTIRFRLPDGQRFVSLKIYDVVGQEVAALVHEQKQSGDYEVVWDASDQPSGVYMYCLKGGGFIETNKLLLLR